MKTTLRAVFAALACVFMTLSAAPAEAGNISRENFSFPKDRAFKIVVFRPDVRVGTMRTTVNEPNAEWTALARQNIQHAMIAQAKLQGIELEFLGEYEGADGEVLDQYRSLFIAVAGSAGTHGVFGNRLPTKLEPTKDVNGKKRYRIDWTLGEEASRLKALTGGDYGLFFFTHDAYSSDGRKMASLFAAALLGVYVPTGIHVGYAGLVDLNTGDLIWFNTDYAMGGDPREADGAVKRVGQLLAGFPGSKPVIPAAKQKK